MPRQGPIDPPTRDIDMEAIADRALGLTPEMAGIVAEEAAAIAARKRLQNVGAKLTARQVLSSRRKRKFLVALAHCGIVSRAATAAGWTANTAYALRKTDEVFRRQWDDALEFSVDTLEEAARHRAVEGTLKPVFQQGQLVGHIREYSDSLLTTLLKANREKFRDRQKVDIDAKGGVLVVPGVAPSDQSWEAAAGANQSEHRGNGQDHDPLA